MKRLFYFMTSFTIMVMLASCHEDSVDDGASNPIENDNYVGTQYQIMLNEVMDNFAYSDFVCYIKADDGSIIVRSGDHKRSEETSTLTFQTGLKDGIYRLLYLETDDGNYGLGCRVEIIEGSTPKVLDIYNEWLELTGSGTEVDPFIVGCDEDFERIKDVTNNTLTNNLLTDDTYFRQECDIDMEYKSYRNDNDYGWLPIGSTCNTPFRGIFDGAGYSISNLWIDRSASSGIGLFGFVENALIKNVNMSNPKISGFFATGGIIGATVTAADHETTTCIYNCTTTGGYVGRTGGGGDGSLGTGGLVGAVDMYCAIYIEACENIDTEVYGGNAAGGIIGSGSVTSKIYIENSDNSATVTSNYTGAGGLVGASDSLYVVGCANTGSIQGSKSYASCGDNGCYGTGGIAGGAGVSFIYSSTNSGKIDGYIGVGGIVGSSRIGVSSVEDDDDVELLFNSVLISFCSNSGYVSGYTAVGGLNGEAQLGCYESYNNGKITATSSECCVGGVAGNTSIAVIHNTINNGEVSTDNGYAVGGIVGQCVWGSLFANQNYGDIEANSDYLGGVAGVLGSYSITNYCSNAGDIVNMGSGCAGGIVGIVGDPHEFSGMDIAHCVLGSVSCVMAPLGLVFSFAGEAATGLLHECLHVLHIAHTIIDITSMLSEGVLTAMGVTELANEEEIEFINTALSSRVMEFNTNVSTQMDNIRNSFSASESMDPDFNGQLYTNYMSNLKDVIAFYVESEENCDLINYNINMTRESRCEEIEHEIKKKEIIQETVAGVCLVCAAVALVVALVASGGTATPVVAEICVAGFSFAGGVNNIVMGTTDFSDNPAVVSQCVNWGNITSSGDAPYGGVVAKLSNYVILENCLNVGGCSGDLNSCGVVYYTESKSEINNCMNVNSSYYYTFGAFLTYADINDAVYYDDGGSHPEYYDNGLTGLSYSEICNPSYYEESWCFQDDTQALWYLNNTQGYFPIPYKSKMSYELEFE